MNETSLERRIREAAGKSRVAPGQWDIHWESWWTREVLSRWRVGREVLSGNGWLLCDDNWGFGNYDKTRTFKQKITRRFVARLFYVLKALICIVLGLNGKPDWHSVTVACYDFGPGHYEYGGSSWTACDVGHGFLENWYVREYRDSSC